MTLQFIGIVLAITLSSCGPSGGSDSLVYRPSDQQDQQDHSEGSSLEESAPPSSATSESSVETSSIASPSPLPHANPSTESTPSTHLGALTSESTTTTSEQPALSNESATLAAELFLAELVLASANENFEVAVQFWTGYPYPASERSERLQSFIAANRWLADGDVELSVVRAWSFQPATAMTIVALSDRAGRGTTSLLLNQRGEIERLEIPLPLNALPVFMDTSVVFNAVPTEGFAVAYIGAHKLPADSITIDHNKLTTTVDLSSVDTELLDGATLILSTATPEYPAMTTVRLPTAS